MLVGVDVSRATRPRLTGTENYSLHLTRALLQADGENQYRLYLQDQPREGFFPSQGNVEYRVLASRHLWTHGRLALDLLRHAPDVLFVPAHVLPVYRGCPSVVTIHDLGYLVYPSAHRPLARLYLRLGTAFSARVATRIIAVSNATRADLISRLGVAPGKVVVVPEAPTPGLAPLADREQGYAVARRFGVRPPYLIALGSVHPRKNLVRLVRAFAVARRRARLPHQLVIAGALGYRAEEVSAAATHAGAGEAVVLTGYVAASDLPPFLGAADALAFPSLYEGFGLPALEAMACGVPVLASNVSSLPEVVGDAGLLFDPLDVEAMAGAIEAAVTDSTLRGDLVQKGLSRAAGFTWERAARETLAVLAEADRA